ncbi:MULTISPECIES: hemopexin repeat-containing protein [unclassified Mesorhizobium]
MVKLSNGKTYVTRGREYLRYSDPNVNSIDPGYPLPIAGNWGRANL